MSNTLFVDYKGESLDDIIKAYSDATIITFSTGGNSYTRWTDYKYYPGKNDLRFRKWCWYEGDYHFEGKVEDIPSLTMINHIEIFKAHGNISDWETIIIRMNGKRMS